LPVKIPIQGSSEQSLTDTIKLADPENPLVGASIWGVSPAQAELLPWQQGYVRAKCLEVADPENHTVEPTRKFSKADKPAR